VAIGKPPDELAPGMDAHDPQAANMQPVNNPQVSI